MIGHRGRGGINRFPRLGARSWEAVSLFAAADNGVIFDPSVLSSMSQDIAGATPVTTFGEPVGRILDRSGRGNHATQATAGLRPAYARVPVGGRRNLLSQSGDITNAAWWAKAGTATASTATQGNFPALNDSISQGATTTATIGTTATGSATLSGTGTITLRLNRQAGGGGVYEGSDLVVTLTATPTRYSVSHTIVNVSQVGFTMQLLRQAAQTATAATIQDSQIDTGAAATAYQLVVTATDITETGRASRFALLDDLVDDTMTTTLPAGTYTVATGDDAGVTILTGQALSGAYTIPGPQRLYGAVVINRALTAVETANLTAWLNARRP